MGPATQTSSSTPLEPQMIAIPIQADSGLLAEIRGASAMLPTQPPGQTGTSLNHAMFPAAAIGLSG